MNSLEHYLQSEEANSCPAMPTDLYIVLTDQWSVVDRGSKATPSALGVRLRNGLVLIDRSNYCSFHNLH